MTLLRPLGLLLALLLVSGCAPPDARPPQAWVEEATHRGLIPLVHQRQEHLMCVPTAASMVLAYRGSSHSPRALKSLTLGGAEATEAQLHSVTSYRQIIEAVSGLGHRWSERTFANTAEGFRRGAALIEIEVARGDPVLIDLSLSRDLGHTVVVVGIDPAAKVLTVIDPDAGAPGWREMTYDQLETVWNEQAYGGDFRAMILT